MATLLPLLLAFQTQATAPAQPASMPAISRERIERHHRILTEDPHVAGTDADKRTAEYVRQRLIEAGFVAELVTYEVLLPWPEKIEVTVVAPKEVKLALKEEGFEWDKDSFDGDVMPPYSAYSASGTVTAPVVYANYGREEDWKTLDGLGIDVRGKIVAMRYGRIFRGTKVKLAQERGAVGVLLYSDPADDGFTKGDVYPRGPMRSETLVERGSILDIAAFPGDPLTPGEPALRDAVRANRDAAANLPRILCQPLSYKDATPVLQSLGGPNAPEGWQGGLPFAYHVGPGPTRVKMLIQIQEKVRPIWNVVGKLSAPEGIRAASKPTEDFVLFGNHRDAWVHGAIDPNSGTAALLETATALGTMVKNGLELRRDVWIGSWDAEEFGIIGSTEWMEDQRKLLEAHCVAYVNVDVGVGGASFGASAVPALSKVVVDAAATALAPRGGSLLDAWRGTDKEAKVGDLGGGSDFMPFLFGAGVPVVHVGFSGRTGVYHSGADDHWFMKTHVDPDFAIHGALATYLVGLAQRLATAAAPPLRYGALGPHLRERLAAITGLPATAKDRVEKAIAAFETAAKRLDERLDQGGKVDGAALVAIERAFLDRDGLPGRPFFRHLLFGTSTKNGYGADPLPALSQACAGGNADQIAHEAERLAAALARAQAQADKALQ